MCQQEEPVFVCLKGMGRTQSSLCRVVFKVNGTQKGRLGMEEEGSGFSLVHCWCPSAEQRDQPWSPLSAGGGSRQLCLALAIPFLNFSFPKLLQKPKEQPPAVHVAFSRSSTVPATDSSPCWQSL